MMHGREKSDSAIVAGKPTNKARVARCGAGGAKGGDQGECELAKHVPDAEPDNRDTGAGSHTASGSPSHTRGGSRMPELGTYGSVRGARGNSCPYRDHCSNIAAGPSLMWWTAPAPGIEVP